MHLSMIDSCNFPTFASLMNRQRMQVGSSSLTRLLCVLFLDNETHFYGSHLHLNYMCM